MRNGNADVADGPVIGLLVNGERRLRVVLALARLFVWQEQFCACIVLTDAQVAEIDQHLECSKPVVVRRDLAFSHFLLSFVTIPASARLCQCWSSLAL